MSTTHTSWQGRAEQSNQKERKRVSKKYPGVKKTNPVWTEENQNADPFHDNDPITDDMASDRKHTLANYTAASGLPKVKAKKILTETDTLQKK